MKNQLNISGKICRILAVFLSLLLLLQQTGFAQAAAELNIAGHLSAMRNSLAVDKFRPLHLRYLEYLPQDNTFKLLLDKGDAFPTTDEGGWTKDEGSKAIVLHPSPLIPRSEAEFQSEVKQLMQYFLIGLTLPNDSFWVNLRPDSPDKIIDNELARTDIGRIMLETDLQLKKDTARYTSPDTPEGKLYWDKLYKKAGDLFGSENITIPTLTRPWIVPGEIIIRETTDDGRRTNAAPSAYIYKATLKVMLEEDYLEGQGSKVKGEWSLRGAQSATKPALPARLTAKPWAGRQSQDPRLKALNEYSSQLIRELIIPKLTKEVNTSKRYASLRQVYYSLILSQWFKARFSQQSLRGTPTIRRGDEAISTRINSRNLSGLTSKAPWSKATYFQAYQKNFQEGEYNIKEPVYTPTGQVVRSYMSGGVKFDLQIAPFGSVPSSGSPIIAIAGGNKLVESLSRSRNLIEINSSSLDKSATASSPLTQEPIFSNSVIKIKTSLNSRIKTTLNSLNFAKEILARRLSEIYLQIRGFLNEPPQLRKEFDDVIDIMTEKLGLDKEVGKRTKSSCKIITNIPPNLFKNKLDAYFIQKAVNILLGKDWDKGYLHPVTMIPKYLRNNKHLIIIDRAIAFGDAAETIHRPDYEKKVNLGRPITIREYRLKLVAAEAGHAIFHQALKEADVSIDRAVDETFDTLAQWIAVPQLWKNYDYGPEKMIIEALEKARENNIMLRIAIDITREPLPNILTRAKKEFVLETFNGLLPLDELSEHLDKDYHLFVHSVCRYLANYFVEKSGSVDEALRIVGDIIRNNDRSWINDYRTFKQFFNEAVDKKQSSTSGSPLTQEPASASSAMGAETETSPKSLTEQRNGTITIEPDASPILQALLRDLGTRKALQDLHINQIGVQRVGTGIEGSLRESGVHHEGNKPVTTYRLECKPDASIATVFHEILHAFWRNNPTIRNHWRMKDWGAIKTMDRGFDKELRVEEAFCDLFEWEMFVDGGIDAKVGLEKENERLSRNERIRRSNEIKTFFIQALELNQGLKKILEFLKYMEEDISVRRIPKASSSSAMGDTKGGIDLRFLPIVTQAVSNLSAALRDSPLRGQSLLRVNLDEEWRQIERMASSGIRPSVERIKEYAQASSALGRISQDRDKIIVCISDILRQEEESCDATEPALRDILIVLESMGGAQELKEVFLGV